MTPSQVSFENVSTSTLILTLAITTLLYLIFTSKFVRRFRSWVFATWYFNGGYQPFYEVYGPILKTVISGLEENLKVVDGDIVDLGTGFGKILEYLPSGCSIIAVEPSQYMIENLKIYALSYPGINIKKIVEAFAEDLSEIESGSVAAVTCSLVLCTVKDRDRVLKEVKRILKPGGYFCFMEHVKAPEGMATRFLQYVLKVPWKFICEGCDLTCQTWINMDRAGFKELNFQFHYIKTGFVVTDHLLTGYGKM